MTFLVAALDRAIPHPIAHAVPVRRHQLNLDVPCPGDQLLEEHDAAPNARAASSRVLLKAAVHLVIRSDDRYPAPAAAAVL